jgi:hypothetical protein
MKWGTRNLFLATTSGVAIGAVAVSAALAAEEMVLPDGRTLILKDDGRYEFVDKTFGEPTKAQPADPAAADIVVMPAAMQGARTISGTLGIYAGGSFHNGSSACNENTVSADCDYFTIGGNGRVDLPFDLNIDGIPADALSVQLDVVADANFTEHQDTNTNTTIEGTYGGQAVLGAHLSYREVNRYLFGLFGAAGRGAIDDTDSSNQLDADLFAVGVEGQVYFDDITAYLQGGYITADNDTSTNVASDGWFIRGVGRYFLNEGRTKVAAELSFAQGENTDDVDILGWGIEGEHEIYSWAGGEGYATAFVKYNGLYYHETISGGDVDNTYGHTFLVGVRFAINNMSLLDTDRKGATLDLPDIGRWMVGSAYVDG